MKIGVTGTRSGMTDYQMQSLLDFMQELVNHVAPAQVELHHGDCVGADVEAATIARELGCKVVCHPPVKTELRAYHASDEHREPQSYFARNRNIVNETELLIVLPYQNAHQTSGGTWYTHDYALKVGKPVFVIFPGPERDNY